MEHITFVRGSPATAKNLTTFVANINLASWITIRTKFYKIFFQHIGMSSKSTVRSEEEPMM